MELSKATRRDAKHVVDLVLGMLQEMASHGGDALGEEERIRSALEVRFTDSLDKEDHVFLVAAPEGGPGPPAGLIEASIVAGEEVFQPKSVFHVHSLYVDANHRGQGLGGRLLQAGLQWGRRKGCLEAELNVLVGNPARKLYENMGFETVELRMRLGL
jgi:GNAT superfamily N-acetyltransferase